MIWEEGQTNDGQTTHLSELIDYQMQEWDDRVICIGRCLTPQLQEELVRMLNEFNDVFSWKTKDMYLNSWQNTVWVFQILWNLSLKRDASWQQIDKKQ